ncbi:TraB/GumN family protein [Psychromonas aquimarina]|uniref:TraB/GumN family protein n=1 Tax=Psychromonas aquimarina TaxID=444919 RepID=UPI000404D292|nr:TraB/GumN family protein [Psychromonas aquimarina]
MFKFVLKTLALTFCSLTVQAESSVWKVSLGEESIYIGGTVHLLRHSDFPLPPEFDIAYKNSDRIFFETDIAALSDPEAQGKLLKSMTAAPGSRIDKLLSPETMEKLSDAVSQRGMNVNSLMSFKASMIVTVLQMTELKRLGVNIEGVDAYFHERAVADGMPVGELETLEQQLSFLSKMGEGKEEEFVRSSLHDLDELKSMYEGVVSAWRNGDRKQLEALFISEMKQDFPEVYEQLLVQRNNNWLPKIKSMFKEPGTEYILVGAGHLIGPDGILQRLEKEGYKVTQVKVKP